MQQANHPNRNKRTYWYVSHRGFANEYTVGIATEHEMTRYYEAIGYTRIDYSRAIRELCNRGDEATKIEAQVTIDGQGGFDRFEVARKIAKGEVL
jgi:hypothetical protein